MVSEEIRRLLRTRPFQAFRIHVTDQAMYEIPHPDWMMLNPAGTMLVVMDADGYFYWVSTAHVTRISPLPESLVAQPAG